MQILYLSNRPEVFAGTWAHVKAFMPWIESAVVVAPPGLHAQFADDDQVTLVDEQELTGLSGSQLLALDHVPRNVTLRRAAIDASLVGDRFVLSDDDYRPMKPVSESFFADEEGRDIGYYFYDLSRWPGDDTSFDEAQHVTSEVLGYLGAPRKAYGAHQPQLMRRSWWDEAFEAFDALRSDAMVDEWSLYFNIARWRHPEATGEPRPYRTMCWPPRLHEFPLWVRPAEYAFENFYPEFYQPGNLFDGLSPDLDVDTVGPTSVEKLIRWSDLGRRAERLDFDADLYDPWTKQQVTRTVLFRALRRARQGYGYLTMGSRQDLGELASRFPD